MNCLSPAWSALSKHPASALTCRSACAVLLFNNGYGKHFAKSRPDEPSPTKTSRVKSAHPSQCARSLAPVLRITSLSRYLAQGGA
jgi:hypothetical protein